MVPEGVDNSPDGIELIRDDLIEFRNKALDQGLFSRAVALSHAIAMLYDYKELMEKERQNVALKA